jgi:hypothetical protein
MSPPSDLPRFSFSHDNSVAQHWPFGLGDVTTKIVAEPARAGESVESYWVVRSDRAFDGELTAEVALRPEFPGTPFEPVREVDYVCVTGLDRNGATTTELAPGRLSIHIPPHAGARQSGFIVRARFPTDDAPAEPPKSLLVEIVRIVDERGREMPLGRARARWLIVEPDSASAHSADANASSR